MSEAVIEERRVALNEVNTLVIPTRVTPIYPVRYAYANFFAESLHPASDPPPLSTMLNATSISQAGGYVVRLLRPGWIYIREENGPGGGHFQIFKYQQIENNGKLEERYPKYQFINGVNAKGGLKEDLTGAIKGGYPFVFVRKEVTEISIAYSEHEWHADVIDRLNGSEGERASSMQRVRLQGEDLDAVPATHESLTALVEDYRQKQARLLSLKSSTTDPGIKNLALDVLTTQASYHMSADEIAAALRRKSKPGEVARIVALHDPVGRQRDIAEIHAKMAVWEKAYASHKLYPFTIGQIIDQLKQSPNKELKSMVQDSINWQEFDQFWRNIDGEFQLFKQRQSQFANLYRAFMSDPVLTGKAGSLDTYFRKFFCHSALDAKAASVELEKLCDVAAGVFNGIASTEPGKNAIESLLEDHANANNVYVVIFEVFRKIVTTPQAGVDWAVSVDKLLQQLGPMWGELKAFSIYESQLANRARYKYSAKAVQYTVKQILPYIHKAMGIKVDSQKRVRYTPEQLAKVFAEQLRDSAGRYPGAPNTGVLGKAERTLHMAEKLFNWGERQKKTSIPRYIELSLNEVVRLPGTRFAFVLPKSVGEVAGLAADVSFAGLSAYINVSTIYEIFFQAEYKRNDPLVQGSIAYDTINLTAALTSLTVDVLGISRATVGVSVKAASSVSHKSFAALAPRLGNSAEALMKILASKLVNRVIVAANVASAVTSVWSGISSWQSNNRGEAMGHITLAVGSVVVAGAALYGFGATAAAAGGAASTTVVGAPPGLVAAVVGLLCVGAGATLLWMYGKSDFQKMLENCFWGNSKRYGFWEKDRPTIVERISAAEEIAADEKMTSSFQIELQEFSNCLYMPALEINSDEGLLDFKGDKRIYTLRFTLPRFQAGVSEVLYEVRTRHFDADIIKNGVWRKHEGLTVALNSAMNGAAFQTINGASTVILRLEAFEDIELFWVYKPQRDVTVPLRYLTENGIASEPVLGMINGDLH